jgi:hypothetical protein
MAATTWTAAFRDWVATFAPDSELATARQALHRFVSVQLPPGIKTRAELRLEAEFDTLARQLPGMVRDERQAPAFVAMVAALRALLATLGPAAAQRAATHGLTAAWPGAAAAFDHAQCDACCFFLDAATRQALA